MQPTTELDTIVLDHIARAVCAPERCDALVRSVAADRMELPHAWSTLVTAGGTVSRNYLLHLIERIEVREKEIAIIPRAEFAAPGEFPIRTRDAVHAGSVTCRAAVASPTSASSAGSARCHHR